MLKLIVIEGLDGSGKETQMNLVADKLSKDFEYSVCKVSFPDYNSLSSGPVRLYLDGKLGQGPENVSAYAASSFFAIDRYISYNTSWKQNYLNNECIICNRYTSSNIIYQMAKLPKTLWDQFINWVIDYEHIKLRLPIPDIVIYLDVDICTSNMLLNKRYNGIEAKKDIHEKNLEFLEKCHEAAYYSAQKFDWKIVNCMNQNNNIYEKTYILSKILKELLLANELINKVK